LKEHWAALSGIKKEKPSSWPKGLAETSMKPETCGKNAGVTPKAEIQMSDIPHTGTDQQRWNSWFNALQHVEVFAQHPGCLNPASTHS